MTTEKGKSEVVIDHYEKAAALYGMDCFDIMFKRGSWMSDPNFKNTIPLGYNQYHPYVCNVCKRGPQI